VKLLITGASGVLGSELVRLALDAGDEVVACCRRSDPPGGRACRLDVRDAEALARVIESERPDSIIHTAYVQDGSDARSTNVEGSRNVAVSSRAVSARLVHVSTDLVFDGRGKRPYREQDEPRPVIPYGESKHEAERVVADACPEALIVRPSLFYGGVRPTRHELLAIEAARGRADAAFFADELRSPTPVPDLARALLDLSRRDLAGVLHLAGPVPLDRYGLAQAIAHAAGADPGAIRFGLASELAPERPRFVVLDSGRAAELGIRLRAPADLLRRVVTEAR